MKKYLFPLSKRSLSLIIAGVAMNLIGESIASYYGLPLYMDSIGTFIVSILLGPLAGSVTGVIMNMLTGPAFSYEWLYAIVSIGGAFTVGILFYKKEEVDSFKIISASVITGLIMTALSTPINVIFNGGMTGNRWGDALSEMLMQYIDVKTICCIAGEIIVNVPDKILTLILLMWLFKFFRSFGLELIPEENKKSGKTGDKNGLQGFIIISTVSLILGLMSSHTVYAAKYVNFNSDCADTFFGTDEGLSSSEINAIAQTGDGYIWAGAYSGLYRYNGNIFEKTDIDPRITNAMCLFTDKDGKLWIGTNDSGVACYDPYTRTTEFFSTREGLCSDSVRSICEDTAGNIYIGTASSLCRIRRSGRVYQRNERGSSGSKITVYDGLKDIFCVNSLVNIGENRICGVTDNGLLFIMENGSIIYSMLDSVEGESFHSVGYSKDGEFLVGTTGKTLVFLRLTKEGFEEKFLVEAGEYSNFNKILYEKKYEGYFLACDNGLGFIDVNGMRQDLTREGFSSAVSDILSDKQGNIWFSSSKQGIMKMSPNPFTDLFKKLGTGEKSVNAVMIDGNDIYIASDEGAIKANLITNELQKDSIPDEVKSARIRHILKDSSGNLWYATYGSDGVVMVKPDGTLRSYNAENSDVLGMRFRFTMELKDGRILVASQDGLSFLKDSEVVKTIGVEDGLEVPKVLSAYEDRDSIWVGTDGGGVYLIKDDKVCDHVGKEEGLNSEVIMKIVPCKGGWIYVASNGLYYQEGDKKVRKLENFPYTNDYDIYISEDHRAFVLSGAGLYIVDEDDLLADKKGYSYTLLNRKCGLISTLTANAWYAVSNERLYLCCTEGVYVLDTEDYAVFDSHYQIVLRSVTKDDVEIEMDNGVYNIPAGPGQICITPAVLNYTISDPLICVTLEGIDKTGKTMRQSELESLYYPSIPYGMYSFNVRVLDDSGKKVLKEMVFLIYKEAKLYEYTYFKIYLTINIVLLLGIIVWLFAKMGNMAVISRQYDQIREAKEDAEVANRAKSHFLAQMSHEIRTPINAVLGMDEMILRESRDPDIRSYAKDIYKAGNTLLSLINDLLDSSKIESGKMEIIPVEYELKTLIRDLVNMISQRAQAKDLQLITQIDPELPRVLFGDDVRLRQVIVNILTNAVKYTVTGSVTLRFKGERSLDNLKLHVEVEDTGIGIKEEDMPKLFEAYRRIEEGRNRRVEGTGLGMNITVQLLEMMGSHLQVDSIYGKGSKFYFDIDQKIVDSARIGEFNPHAAIKDDFAFLSADDAFTAQDARILVVDDNSMNRKVLRSLLKPLKVQVSEAAGGVEALAKSDHEDFDVILMDHMMPEMDGIETMKRFREKEKYRDIPIFALTANAVTGAKEEYIRLGFDGFISKPVAMDRLEDALRQALPKDLIHPLTQEEKDALKKSEGGTSSPVPDDLPMVEGLDWGYAWMHMPDRDMLRDGIQTFYEVIDIQADRLQGYYEALLPKAGNRSSEGPGEGEKDSPLDQYRIQVHAMKSTAATIGIVPLAGVAKMLEFAAKDSDMKTIIAMHAPFIKEWRSYKEKLKGIFGLGLDEGGKKEGDRSLLSGMLDKLRPAFEVLDVDTMDGIMETLKGYTFGEETDSLLVKLNAAVKDMDEEAAYGIIDEIEGGV